MRGTVRPSNCFGPYFPQNAFHKIYWTYKELKQIILFHVVYILFNRCWYICNIFYSKRYTFPISFPNIERVSPDLLSCGLRVAVHVENYYNIPIAILYCSYLIIIIITKLYEQSYNSQLIICFERIFGVFYSRFTAVYIINIL